MAERRKRDPKMIEAAREEARAKRISEWIPKTALGKKVKNDEINSLDDIFNSGKKILEPEIVDMLVPNFKEKMVDFKKTTRVTRQGRNFSFRITMLIGDGQGYIGLGTAKDKERFPAIAKATRNAKLNLKKVRKGSGSWEDRSKENNSIPFKVTGDCGSVKITLLPAPKGTGLVVGDNIKDVFRFAGVKDIWSKTSGKTASTLQFVSAAVDALAATNNMRLTSELESKLGDRR